MRVAIGVRDRAPAALRTELGTRYWEIDLARTVAIAMMVAYHSVYDVDLLVPGLGPDPFRGFWGALPEATGSLFLFVAGASLAVSDARLASRGASALDRMRRHARHALIVLSAAMVVTVATRVVFEERYVRFGILHAIGIAILIAAVTVRFGRWNLLLGGAAILGGVVVSGVQTRSTWTGIVGMDPEGFSSVDHWPLLPWIGPMLIGVAIGATLYPRGTRGPVVGVLSRARGPHRSLTALGRRSLIVYLAHQLVLIPIVWVVLAAAGQDVPWPR